MKVGIPRALLYYRYGNFWNRFFSELGVEVILSPKTDKTILEKGLGKVSSEVCLPIKVICGHIEELKDKVDFVFLPRLVYLGDKLYACPKMIGIVDIVGLNFSALLRPKIKNDFFLPHFQVGLALTHNPMKSFLAYQRAKEELKFSKTIPDFPSDQPKIGLISHFYNLGDDFIAHDIIATFRKNGFLIYTKEDLPPTILENSKGFAGKIRWIYERELYNAFNYYLDKIDGICNIISFGCGPDSLVGEIMADKAKTLNRPFLQLIIDEHTGRAGLITRLEAFIELVKKRIVAN
ncbi:MAG: acyl-CoA dehydratase activase-related protein [candidate division WOR-3 bacterium]|nr:acyl-CoA dehydratase activase-related protein [candidate division WOR-3 bacterium]